MCRPSSFPPSYEESQSSQDTDTAAPHCSSHLLLQSEAVLDVDGEIIGLAPPLYSQVSSEAPDCTWSWEPPPRYSQVERHHPRDSSPAPWEDQAHGWDRKGRSSFLKVGFVACLAAEWRVKDRFLRGPSWPEGHSWVSVEETVCWCVWQNQQKIDPKNGSGLCWTVCTL